MAPGFMARRRPAVGDVFTKLTVIALPVSGTQILSRDRWTCRCSCTDDQRVEVLGSRLIYGSTRSCGCLNKERRGAHVARLRERHSTRVSWRALLRRSDVNIDPTWQAAFDIFFADLGLRPTGHVLSRKDLEGPYNAANCFWEPRRTQVERVRVRRWATPNAGGWEKGPTKRCSKCNEEKSIKSFYCNNASKTKLHSSCKRCCEEKRRLYYRKNVPKLILANAKTRALEKRLEFDLTIEDLEPLPTHCPVFGMELTYGGKNGRHRQDSSFSIDRKDNAKGYVRGNVAVISWLANRFKSDAEAWQLERVAAWMRGKDFVPAAAS